MIPRSWDHPNDGVALPPRSALLGAVISLIVASANRASPLRNNNGRAIDLGIGFRDMLPIPATKKLPAAERFNDRVHFRDRHEDATSLVLCHDPNLLAPSRRLSTVFTRHFESHDQDLGW